jgi:pimeloyl-ACP methyl ester carboxylesterase
MGSAQFMQLFARNGSGRHSCGGKCRAFPRNQDASPPARANANPRPPLSILAIAGFSLVVLIAMSVASPSGAHAATPRFEPSDCPKTPEPIPDLQKARCGFLVVPENRAKPNGRNIRLAVAIIRAMEKPAKPDPVVFMTGGPGAAAILDTPFLVAADINRDRDLVIMAQRGTKYSEPTLDCPSIDRFYARQVGLVYDALKTGQIQAEAARKCHDRFVARGIDLSAYNTTENAADFADLRRVLGYEEWNVYGYSYGSDLALSYLRDHPEGIRTVTIDSVVPPNIVSLPWTWSSAFEGITTIFDACKNDERCDRRYPQLLKTFTRIVKQLEADPIVARVRPPQGGRRVKVVLDGGTIVNMLVGNNVKAADVPRAIHELADGNPEIFLEVRAAASEVPEVIEQAQGMTQSFICREWAPYGGPEDIRRAGKRVFPTFPDSVLRQAPQLPFEHRLCKVWDVPKGPAAQRKRVRSDVPALVVSGTFDAKTGAEWGRYAADTLDNSTYVQIKGIGHWVIVQSPCAQRIFNSFLNDPLSPETECADRKLKFEFNIGPKSAASRGSAGVEDGSL